MIKTKTSCRPYKQELSINYNKQYRQLTTIWVKDPQVLSQLLFFWELRSSIVNSVVRNRLVGHESIKTYLLGPLRQPGDVNDSCFYATCTRTLHVERMMQCL